MIAQGWNPGKLRVDSVLLNCRAGSSGDIGVLLAVQGLTAEEVVTDVREDETARLAAAARKSRVFLWFTPLTGHFTDLYVGV